METATTSSGQSSRYQSVAGRQADSSPHLASKSNCWYCNKPLYGVRHYCGPECREAMFDDNEYAKQRRLIFGCQC